MTNLKFYNDTKILDQRRKLNKRPDPKLVDTWGKRIEEELFKAALPDGTGVVEGNIVRRLVVAQV